MSTLTDESYDSSCCNSDLCDPPTYGRYQCIMVIQSDVEQPPQGLGSHILPPNPQGRNGKNRRNQTPPPPPNEDDTDANWVIHLSEEGWNQCTQSRGGQQDPSCGCLTGPTDG